MNTQDVMVIWKDNLEGEIFKFDLYNQIKIYFYDFKAKRFL
jgi:hypothetical protein